MPVNTNPAEVLANVPLEVRGRILSGLRWTLWLSALAVPFAYGVNVLLARTSPEAIGTYGLVGIYISLVTCFLYFGGDAVVIRFAPQLYVSQRCAFVGSYFAVICLLLMPWLVLAVVSPRMLSLLYGGSVPAKYNLLLLCVSPIYILFSLLIAALKSSLEFRSAQTILRFVPIGFFAVYALLFLFARDVLSTRFAYFIWGTYLLLCAGGLVWAIRRVLVLPDWRCEWSAARFFLPSGFWRFAFATQQCSVLNFFMGRMDYVLIVNCASVAVLGHYVAVRSMAAIVILISGFFLDTLMPSLSRLLAQEDYKSAGEVLAMQMRILFLAEVVTTTGLVLLAPVVATVLGPRYHDLTTPIMVMAALVGLASPGMIGGILLSSIGKPQRAVWVSVGQLLLYVVCFWWMWPRLHLLGATIAFGLATLMGNTVMVIVAQSSFPVPVRIWQDYGFFTLTVVAASVFPLYFAPLATIWGLLAWPVAVGAFLLFSGYTIAECHELLDCFLPTRLRPAAEAL